MDPIPGALALESPLEASVVTVGTFDGVHRGHRVLLDRARAVADRGKWPVVAYTFHPHPARLFAPSAPKTLMPIDRRVAALREAGADLVVVETFDRDFANVGADDWVERYLVQRLRPQHVVVGFNFSYGRGRGGDPDHLRSMGLRHRFSVEIVEAVTFEARVASSTEIRRAVEDGRMDDAAFLLGRPFAVVGTVVPGDQRGRTLGFPTANVDPDHEQIPAPGVYAGHLEVLSSPQGGLPEGTRFPSVTNVGARPTFGGGMVTVESHVLDAAPDLYGARVSVEFRRRLRAERAFDGPAALRAQIDKDVAAARAVLEVP
ncbi:MAG: bifunctional riboflavin kinase/FAD synthetase [Myxococcota bacterium]